VLQRFAALFGSGNLDGKVFFNLLLADQFIERSWAEGIIHRILRAFLVGQDVDFRFIFHWTYYKCFTRLFPIDLVLQGFKGLNQVSGIFIDQQIHVSIVNYIGWLVVFKQGQQNLIYPSVIFLAEGMRLILMFRI
jgi:hypothetical protein